MGLGLFQDWYFVGAKRSREEALQLHTVQKTIGAFRGGGAEGEEGLWFQHSHLLSLIPVTTDRWNADPPNDAFSQKIQDSMSTLLFYFNYFPRHPQPYCPGPTSPGGVVANNSIFFD